MSVRLSTDDGRVDAEHEQRRWIGALATPLVAASALTAGALGGAGSWLIGAALVCGPGLAIAALVYLAFTSDLNGKTAAGVGRPATATRPHSRPAGEGGTGMTQVTDSKSVLQRYVAAIEVGDDQTVLDLFAEDATWTLAAGDLTISGTWEGRDSIFGEFLATALSNYEPDSVSFEITGMISEGDQVAMQWTSRARTQDGRPYENDCIGVFTIRDGKIQSVREYMDTLYARDTVFGAAQGTERARRVA